MLKSAEWVASVDNIESRIYTHLPSPQVLHRPMSELELKSREKHRKNFQGADFTFVTHEGQFYYVPAWHEYNNFRADSKAVHYAKALFEGGSFMAVRDSENPDIINHGNIILATERNARFRRSWRALGYEVPSEEINQGVFDLAAVLGENVLRGPDGVIARAYIRPYGAVIQEGVGVGSDPNDEIYQGLYIRYMRSYFPGREIKIYEGSGLDVVVFLNQQRLEPIFGKLARNYPLVGDLTKRARQLGAEEALILAPHGFDPETGGIKRIFAQDGDAALTELFEYGHFSDGPGEGIIAVRQNYGKNELWFPPNSVNQLPSTTMAYVCKYLAPHLGFTVVERPFGYHELRQGKIDNVLMVGNAVGVAPIGSIRTIHPDAGRGELEKIEMTITQPAELLRDQFFLEITESIPASDSSLLTRVDFKSREAEKAREILYNAWNTHF